MNNIYYHQRNSNKELSYEIDLTFWKSFTGYIRRISNVPSIEWEPSGKFSMYTSESGYSIVAKELKNSMY